MLALVKYIFKIKDKGVNVGDELATLYAGELNPVAAKAQRKVPVPEGYVHFILFKQIAVFISTLFYYFNINTHWMTAGTEQYHF